jgi:Pretoxin HINT domain
MLKNIDPVITFLTLTDSEQGNKSEHITTTPEHPFYVQAQAEAQARPKPMGHEELSSRWVGAGHLLVGDKIKQADGTVGVVSNVFTFQQTQEMFNLTVSEAHTFYVGNNGWLVHNINGPMYGPYQLTGGKTGLPKPPNGMSMPEIGKLIGWGGDTYTGNSDALNRITTMSSANIQAPRDAGIRSDYARTLADGYRSAPQPNPTAAGRATLMDKIAEWLAQGESECL